MADKMAEKNETKRLRSPAYPSLTLERAIELADKFYKKENKHKATPEVANEHLGYSASSSAGMRALAALISFGLLDASGQKADRRVWVSELGRAILLDHRENSRARMEAIREAALRPPIYRQLWESWDGDFPSDSTIKTTLQKDLHFNATAVDGLIKGMKDTFEFAKLLEHDTLPEESVDEGEVGGDSGNEDTSKLNRRKFMYQPQAKANEEMREIVFPLMDGVEAVLHYRFPLSEENFNYLRELVDTVEKIMTGPKAKARHSNGNEESHEETAVKQVA